MTAWFLFLTYLACAAGSLVTLLGIFRADLALSARWRAVFWVAAFLGSCHLAWKWGTA